MAMSSGSKRAPDAGTVLQERELRNIKAKTNVLLHMDAKRQKQEPGEYEEPGTALKLLEAKEYGDWETHHWVDGKPPLEEEDHAEEDHEEEEDHAEDAADAAPGEEDEGDVKEEEPQQEEEPPQEEEVQEEEDGKGKGKGKKGKGRGGKKGSAGRKPWWSQHKWHQKGEGGGGKKGQGKGKFDQWGGEYCHGGYRAVNGEFFGQLGCQFALESDSCGQTLFKS